MLRFEHVSLSYGSQKIIDDISFEIQEGQMAVLIGSSGCGKTTTLKMINRLIEPTSGKIYINGKDIAAQDRVELRRHIGYVIQQIGLFPNMTVAQNICVTTAVSSIICSVIGMLIIPLFNISTTMAASIGLKGFSAGVIGGFGYLPGAILGGLFIGVVENLAVVVLPAVYKDIVSFVLLIIFLLVHPSGFLGKKA